MSVPLLEIKGIKVRYSGLPVLHDVSLAVNAGETVCVVGANGAGKSTILRAVMGAQRAFEGQILFAGRQIQRLRTEEIVRLVAHGLLHLSGRVHDSEAGLSSMTADTEELVRTFFSGRKEL